MLFKIAFIKGKFKFNKRLHSILQISILSSNNFIHQLKCSSPSRIYSHHFLSILYYAHGTHSAQFLSRIFIHFEAVQERFKSVDRSECVLEQHSPCFVEFADIHHGILVTPRIHATRLHTESNPSLHQSLDIRATKMQLLPSTISQFLFLPTFDHDSFVSPAFYPSFFCNFPSLRKLFEEAKCSSVFFFFKRRFRTNEVILIERKLRRFSREFSIRGCIECFGIVICTGKNILSLLLSSK